MRLPNQFAPSLVAAPRAPALPGAPAFALPARRSLLASLAVLLAAMLLALLADIGVIRSYSGTYHVDVGSFRDFFFLDGVYDREGSASSTWYRWTGATSTVRLSQLGVAQYGLLTLNLGGRPTPGHVDLTLNGQPLGQFTAETAPRHYMVMLPLRAAAQLAIGIDSATIAEPRSDRRLGIKIEGFTIQILRDSTMAPPLRYFLWQSVLLLAAQLIALRLGWRWHWPAALLAALALVGALLLGATLLLAYAYLSRLALAAAILTALTWGGLALAERRLGWAGHPRDLRMLWVIALAACTIRLFGVLYPTFGGQDLRLNLERLAKTSDGQMFIIDDSSEFAGGLTIYPPGPYLAVLPGLVVTSDQSALLQGTLALLDGFSAFMIGLLARRLGGNRQAAMLAAVMYLASYSAFSALAYGFSAQIFGQWLTAPIALVLLAEGALRSWRSWLIAALLLLIGLFSHIGVAVLGVTWLGLLALLTARPYRWRPIILLALAGALALVLLYIDIAPTMFAHATGKVVTRHAGKFLPGAQPLLLKGALLAYTSVGLALAPLGLALLARSRALRQSWPVPAALLATMLLYFAVDLQFAVQVRYFYFGLPLALAAIGVLLGTLAARVRWAGVVVWSLLALFLFQHLLLWFQVTFADGKFSLTPLTH
ncbi:MAG: hypothetical protein IPP13_21480 [Kouleothrix sp.]|jgi:hypothetical protein|nr:hypothetical protein [Kouleothrix sp.]